MTRPFGFEGNKRGNFAIEGIEGLREQVDTLLIISNNNLLEIVDKKTPLLEALSEADNVLRQGVQGITDLITNPGLINLDFADVKTVMENKGNALMGIGIGTGEDRVIEARKAIYSPLLETTIDGAEDVIVNVTGGYDMTLTEAEDASEIVNQVAGQGVNIWLGTSIDETMKDEIRVTVVATGVRQDTADKPARHRTEAVSPRPSQRFDHSVASAPTRGAAQQTEAPKASAFGEWDLRRENLIRPTDAEPTSTVSVEKFTMDQDEDELDTPPFFRNR